MATIGDIMDYNVGDILFYEGDTSIWRITEILNHNEALATLLLSKFDITPNQNYGIWYRHSTKKIKS